MTDIGDPGCAGDAGEALIGDRPVEAVEDSAETMNEACMVRDFDRDPASRLAQPSDSTAKHSGICVIQPRSRLRRNHKTMAGAHVTAIMLMQRNIS